MSFPVPISSTATVATVAGAQVNFSNTMATDKLYVLVSSTLAWCQQGAAPVATAGNGSWLVPPNTPVLVDGALGAKLSILQHTSGGTATLTQLRFAR